MPIAVAFPVAIVLWFGTYYLLPPLAGMGDMLPRLVFSLKCSCYAILFCFVTGIEAVARWWLDARGCCDDGGMDRCAHRLLD